MSRNQNPNPNELNIVLENMHEGMILLNHDNTVLGMNTAVREILHIPQAGNGQNFLEFCQDPELIELVENAQNGISGEIMQPFDGRQYQILANPVPAETDGSGSAGEEKAGNASTDGVSEADSRKPEIGGATVVFLDVTDHEQAERMRREFTANVSHELKTPLHAISGYAELMMDQIVKPEDVPKFSENIYREAQRTIRMVEDIIALSRLDEGEVELGWEETDVDQIARETLEHLRPEAKEKQIHLSYQGEKAILLAKPSLIQEIIANLCDNAVKYNRIGGDLFVTVKKVSDGVLISVRDTGIGIPKKDQKRIFERFYRVDKSRSREIGGTGLGLSIVKHAVQIHDGRIELASEEGQGTEIRVWLPERTEQEAEEKRK